MISSLRHVASRRSPEGLQASALNELLVVELSRLGDVITMLPALGVLERSFPNAHIRVLVDDRYRALLGSVRMRSEFVGIRKPSTLRGVVNAINLARDRTSDLCVSMSSPRRNAIVALVSRSRRVAGYLSYVDSLTPFLHLTSVEGFGITIPPGISYSRENIYERAAKVCEALGIPRPADSWTLHFEESPEMRNRMMGEGVIPREPYVLIFPFSGWRFRDWNLANHISLATSIAEEIGLKVVFACDKANAAEVSNLSERHPSFRSAVCSNVLEAAILMKGASLVVGGDSGPLHLAAALGVKSVGLYGPAPPELTGPRSGSGKYLYKRVECSPCDQRKCIRPHDTCMSRHTVAEVFSAVSKQLEYLPADASVSSHA